MYLAEDKPQAAGRCGAAVDLSAPGGKWRTFPNSHISHHAWPIHWCEAVDAPVVDCGVHAALAHEAFAARGVRAFRAQFVQRYSGDAAASRRENWGKEGVSDHWINGDAIYHEGNAVLVGETDVKLWDGSAGWWINVRGDAGYGSLAAVRIEADPADFPDGLRWGERRITPSEWVAV